MSDPNKMPNEVEHFDNWFESAVPPEPYTEQHLRWAFNAGGMIQRHLSERTLDESVEKQFATFVAVSNGNETKFDIFKAGFISGRNASTMEQPEDAATITDKVLFPDKPWRVICRVVAEDGSKTAATFTRYFKYEVEAEDFILSLDGDDPNAVFCCGVWYDKSKGPCPNCGRTEQAFDEQQERNK